MRYRKIRTLMNLLIVLFIALFLIKPGWTLYPFSLPQEGEAEHISGSKIEKTYTVPEGKEFTLIITDEAEGEKVSRGTVFFYTSENVEFGFPFSLQDGSSGKWGASKADKVIKVVIKLEEGSIKVQFEGLKSETSPTKPQATATSSEPSPRINYGLWEISRSLLIPGTSNLTPEDTYKLCLNKNQPIPLKGVEAPSCTVNELKFQEETLYWDVTCSTGETEIHYKGDAQYKGDSMKGEYSVKIEGDEKQLKYKITGKRLGTCEE